MDPSWEIAICFLLALVIPLGALVLIVACKGRNQGLMNTKIEFKCPDGHVHSRFYPGSDGACVRREHCLEFVGTDPVDGAGLLCWKDAERVRE